MLVICLLVYLQHINTFHSFQVTETRAENRTYRPRVELCRDNPHDALINERNTLQNTVSNLVDQHNIAEYVAFPISISITSDQQGCLSHYNSDQTIIFMFYKLFSILYSLMIFRPHPGKHF